MNWYKKSQQDINQAYEDVMNQAAGITITGTGQSQTLDIPNMNYSINASDLLNNVKMRLAPTLVENNVQEIDTNPITDPNAQGLAVSSEPGKIYVDVQKIFEQATQSLPATSQLDSVQPDPNATQEIIDQISQMIEAEILETVSHESWHMNQFSQEVQSTDPDFSKIEENPAEQFGQEMRQQYFQY